MSFDEFSQKSLIFSTYNRSMEKGCVVHWPVWSGRIDTGLEGVFRYGGSASLEISSEEEVHFVRKISIGGDPGKFRIYIETDDVDLKKSILIWWDPGDSPYKGDTVINEDAWDSRTVCTDINKAFKFFQEIFNYGKLSEDSLAEMRYQNDPKPKGR